jgi:hypothetical protein
MKRWFKRFLLAHVFSQPVVEPHLRPELPKRSPSLRHCDLLHAYLPPKLKPLQKTQIAPEQISTHIRALTPLCAN